MHMHGESSSELTLSDLLIFNPTSGGGEWYIRFDFFLTSNFISRLSTSSSSFTLSGDLCKEQRLVHAAQQSRVGATY